MSDRIEFRILGPLEVRAAGEVVRVGGPKQRALLAVLLLSANRVVSRDRLIDELLDDAAPAAADHTLRVQVSRLRGVLDLRGGEPRLVAVPPGYRLRVEPGELDLHVFEQRLADARRRLAEGDLPAAVAGLRDAESLWRGRPLADLEFERFPRVEVERLEELRSAAVEERVDAELALGRHAALVAELELRVAEHPYRDRPRGQLMLALYRCGRQADALDAYRAGRALLNERLALDPSPALRQLEQAILRQDPTLEPSAAETAGSAAVTVLAPPEPPPPMPPRAGVREGRSRRRWGLAGALAVAALAAGTAALITVRGSQGADAPAVMANGVGVVDARAGVVRATLAVGGRPGGIAAGAGAVWVTNTASDQLLRIDEARRTIDRIAVGHAPSAVAVAGGEVWVVNQLDQTVSEVNPRALRPVATFHVGNGASAIAVGAGSVWVANTTGATVSRLDTRSGAAATITLGGAPQGIAVGRDGVWVTTSTGQLLLIEPRTDRVTEAVPIGNGPAGVATGGGAVWVANTPDGTVSRFDPGSGRVSKVTVGGSPVGVAYGDGAVWVANGVDGTVARIDPATRSTREVHVGNEPTALAVAGGGVWTTVLPSPASHRGGTLKVVAGPSLLPVGDSVDPAVFAGIGQWQILSMTNDGLVTYRRVGGLAGSTLVPDLATALPAPTDNGRTYTFHLRTGIRYSDGSVVEPEDFRRAIERLFRIGDGYAESFYRGILGAARCAREPRRCTLRRGIVTDDRANTVSFHLASADPDFLYKLAFPMADALPAGTSDHDLGLTPPPATGPYMTKSVSQSRRRTSLGYPLAFSTWTLVRNPHFHRWSSDAQPDGYPDRIVLSEATNIASAVRAVDRGGSDVLLSLQSSGLRQFARHDTDRLHRDPLGATFGLVMNTRVPPFDHLAARRALNYAIDRRRIVAASGGTGRPTCQILPPTLSGYEPYCPYTLDPNPSGSWIAPDLARAQRLVRASGTRGMKVTVSVPPEDATDPTRAIGRAVVSALHGLGYRASIQVVPNTGSGPLADSRSRAQIAWFTWYQDYPAPSDFVTPLLTCQSFIPGSARNLNLAEFCDPTIDRRIRRARAVQASNPGAASQAWRTIDRELTDAAPWLPLYNPQSIVALSARAGNYQYHPFWNVLLDQLWVR